MAATGQVLLRKPKVVAGRRTGDCLELLRLRPAGAGPRTLRIDKVTTGQLNPVRPGQKHERATDGHPLRAARKQRTVVQLLLA